MVFLKGHTIKHWLSIVENWNADGHMCDLYLLYVPFRDFDHFGFSLCCCLMNLKEENKKCVLRLETEKLAESLPSNESPGFNT